MRFWRWKGPAGPSGEAGRLKAAAEGLREEMDSAGFPLAAAYVGLAAEVLEERLPADWGRSASPPGEEVEFEADEHGRVWIVRDGLCDVIGRREAVAAEMRRFLQELPPK